MASNNPYIIVLVYPNCRMRNGDNGVTFECEDPILFPIQRVNTLSDLKSLILSKFGGTVAREIGRVADRLLAPMGNGVFRFRLFRLQGDEHVRVMFDIHGRIMVEQVMELSAEVGHSGGGPSVHSTYVQDNYLSHHHPFMLPFQWMRRRRARRSRTRITRRTMVKADCPIVGMRMSVFWRHPFRLRPAMSCLHLFRYQPILAVPSHYHSLDLDAMHERIPFLDTGEEDYNLDGSVEFWVGHKFRGREAVLQSVKKYSIQRSAEYRVIESDRLKYHVQCHQVDNWCQWSLCVAL
ncbi:hypothetical protein Ahy_A08g041174 isoform B [Arachis hypogaea]|uniref:Transposase MuDR plant domain-containing protein n=1 Tax=Arachis hypogaea TaxID=3818 RepID=A0A445C1U9_ARAHY|nr:hypothetical protein Ahy_A08g041174 isoform B [Arachis hypogaea]